METSINIIPLLFDFAITPVSYISNNRGIDGQEGKVYFKSHTLHLNSNDVHDTRSLNSTRVYIKLIFFTNCSSLQLRSITRPLGLNINELD